MNSLHLPQNIKLFKPISNPYDMTIIYAQSVISNSVVQPVFEGDADVEKDILAGFGELFDSFKAGDGAGFCIGTGALTSQPVMKVHRFIMKKSKKLTLE